ncbi:MAG: phasin family protein [Azospirillaceae bacterium]|nr:phasin family protein [Azospirillaceae bacterium]
MTVQQNTVNPLETVVAQAKDTVENFVKVGQETVHKQYEQALSTTKEQAEKTSQHLLRGYEELTSFSKANVDALVASSGVLVKGFEDIGKAVAAFTRSSVEANVANSKALLTAKSLKELVELNHTFARTSFDALMSETTKLSELSIKVANESLAPINARVNAAVEKIAKPIAA